MSEAKSTKWVRLGDYIEQCDERAGNNFTVDDVVGISTEKIFIATKANMDGVSLNSYKVIGPKEFAYVADTSRRGEKIALAFNSSKKPVLVSSIYTSFRSKDDNQLDPEYLFMLMNREEFDRYARFNSWGSARETFDWSEMCRIEIPLPDIEVQRELVAVYNGLKALADENEALVPKLSAACHAYIVDCREKYPSVQLGKYIEQNNERNQSGLKKVLGMSTTKDFRIPQSRVDYSKLDSYKLVHHNQFVFVPTTDTWKCLAIALSDANMPFVVSPIYVVFGLNGCELLPKFLNLFFKRKEFDRYARYHSWGSARENFSFDEMCRVQIPLPPIEVQQAIVDVFNCAERAKKIAAEARQKLKSICSALVQKAAHS